MAISADQLKQIPLFADLEGKDLERVAKSLRDRTFAAGSAVTEEGKSGVGFFVIESGEATVTVGGSEVRKLGAGDYFGEIALITEAPRTATITADTELKVHGLSPWDFKPIVESHPSMAWALLETLARRLAEQ